MLIEHAKILGAVRSAGEVSGRKKLQKMIYIAKKLCFPFQDKFDFHFYGPYSEELTLRVEELVNMGFLQEKMEKKGAYSEYRYRLTESGEEFLNYIHLEIPPAQDECLEDMNGKNARYLELVSTILYFEDLPREEIFEKIEKVKSKQNYTRDEMEEAFHYIKSLREKAKIIAQ